MLNNVDINFVNLGIKIQHLRDHITVFGFDITFYGILIGIGMLAGILIAQWDAKRNGQDPEVYLDFAIYAIVFSIIGARLYYVVFAWDTYRRNIVEVFNLRGGGMAIYGGVIGAVITLIIYTKVKKLSFYRMADCGCIGLVTGQIIGRWGNFFNCEAFGGFTNGTLAMQIKRSLVNETDISQQLIDNLKIIDGIEYIQVHPTFLYESLWNLGLLLLLVLYSKYKRFDGEILWLYLLGYGLGRTWIEGLRTDQLFIFSTNIPVSQALSIILVIVSACAILWNRWNALPTED